MPKPFGHNLSLERSVWIMCVHARHILYDTSLNTRRFSRWKASMAKLAKLPSFPNIVTLMRKQQQKQQQLKHLEACFWIWEWFRSRDGNALYPYVKCLKCFSKTINKNKQPLRLNYQYYKLSRITVWDPRKKKKKHGNLTQLTRQEAEDKRIVIHVPEI